MNLSNKSKILIFSICAIIIVSIAVVLNMSDFKSIADNAPEVEKNTPGIVLKQSEVIINVGDSFDAKQYVVQAYDDQGINCTDQLIIDEWLSTEFPAEYEVDYIIKNGTEFYDKKTLKVIVEE